MSMPSQGGGGGLLLHLRAKGKAQSRITGPEAAASSCGGGGGLTSFGMGIASLPMHEQRNGVIRASRDTIQSSPCPFPSRRGSDPFNDDFARYARASSLDQSDDEDVDLFDEETVRKAPR
jgi:hypothetical protein